MVKPDMSRPSASIIGYEVPQFIEFLIQSLPQIYTIKLFRPSFSQPIQRDPSIDATEQDLIAHGLAIREKLNLPFWDSVLLYMTKHPETGESVLRRVTRHNPQDLDSFPIHRSECSELRLREMIEDLPVNSMLAISSKVLTGQHEVLHFPMLDFHCPASPGNDLLVKTVLREIGLEGYVAKSGGSYHFYGCTLVDEKSLITILARSLLFCPIIDRAWIAHQLIERACGLRISPGKNYEKCPEIIGIV